MAIDDDDGEIDGIWRGCVAIEQIERMMTIHHFRIYGDHVGGSTRCGCGAKLVLVLYRYRGMTYSSSFLLFVFVIFDLW